MWVAALCLAAALQAGQSGSAPAETVDLSAPLKPGEKSIAEVIEAESDPKDQAELDLPRAVIVPDGEVRLGCWVLFDASTSVNPLGGKLEYEWRQVTGPPLPVPEGLLKEPKLWLFLSRPGQFRFAVRVRNEKGWSLPRETKFPVRHGRPFLTESEGSKLAGAGERVELPGEGWRQVSGPHVELRDEEGLTCFRPARAGQYIFEAPRAGDIPERRGAYVPPGRDGLLGDRRPVARLPKELAGHANQPLLLNGSLSFDPDGAEETQALVARWTTPEKQRGVELEKLPGLKARFKAPRPGNYSVALVVSDGRLESEPPETVLIRIAAPSPQGAASARVTDEGSDYGRDDIRYRKISLGLWGNLDRAVQMFPSRCGAALRIDPLFALPEKFAQIPLEFEVLDGALLHLLDWTARQTGARYRCEGERSFWLTTPLAWAKTEKLESAAVLADALHAQADGSDLMALVTPCFQQILDARPGTSLAFEPARQEIQGVLPASACSRLKELCAALREPEGQGLPPDEPPGPAELRLQRLLAGKSITIQKTQCRLVDALRELAQAGGVAVAFSPLPLREGAGGGPYLSVNISDAPLRDAARTLVALGGFDGCSVEPPGGLWFYRGARPYPSGQLLWDEALVRAYDLARLLPRISPISGEAIAYAVRKRVYPESWKEAGAGVFYHALTKKLLVLHGPAAQRRVLEFLNDLAERGDWALGPAE